MTAPASNRRSQLFSAESVVTDCLRQYILEHRQAGDWLTERELLHDAKLRESMQKKELKTAKGIPRRLLRRALIHLEIEGLLEIIPRVGSRVRALSQREINARMGMRRALEVEVALAFAHIARHSPKLLNQLRQCQREMERIAKKVEKSRTVQDQDGRDFFAADGVFHATICELAGYQECIPILAQIRQRLQLMAPPPLQTIEQFTNVIEEHRKILDAIEGGSDQEIREAAEEHLKKVLLRWFPFLRQSATDRAAEDVPTANGTSHGTRAREKPVHRRKKATGAR